jgi:hypothetical protein
MSSIPPPDDTAHLDGQLMHALTVVNARLSRYVLRFLDADAGRARPMSPAEERELANEVSTAAEGLRARAERREQQDATTPPNGHADEE